MANETAQSVTGLGLSTASGIGILILGFIALALPFLAGLAAVLMLAWVLLFCGVAEGIYAFDSRVGEGFIFKLLLGILYVITGAYLLVRPGRGLLALTLVLAVFLLVDGILDFVLALRISRGRGRGWLLFDGIIGVLLAIFIWRHWPLSAEWVIGTILGIRMIVNGVTRIVVSSAARRVVERIA